ncbi:hypothetical protein MAR_023789 [Mya arenaria]|uniref:Uncharacterized protein n=1 Tax=Mya arenaria TaxID=6604 RepID=A0ABY7DR96_MYAAR|nr:hypothetical protein MAR_023789 [Mya arenaria]
MPMESLSQCSHEEADTRKPHRYQDNHEIAGSIGESRAKALPAFHAFTGCDEVSSFASKCKNTGWVII